MVNFNNETTVATPAKDIIRVLALQARANVFESWEYYLKKKETSSNVDISTVKARLSVWFLEHQAYIKDRVLTGKDKVKYEKMKLDMLINLHKLKEEEVIENILFLNELVDKLKLTRLDTRAVWDRTSLEDSNEAQGL